jgi:hypothetical protein
MILPGRRRRSRIRGRHDSDAPELLLSKTTEH